MKKLIIGILVSLVFIYFSFRGIEYEKLVKGLENLNYIYLVPPIIIAFFMTFLRSIRWGIILSPSGIISQKKLLPINCVGFMAIIVIPMRVGEILRPYLVSTESDISLSSAMATVIVERVFDILTLLGFLLVVLFSLDLPGWLIKSSYVLLGAMIALVFFLCLLYFKPDLSLRILKSLIRWLPEKLQKMIDSIVRNFIGGLKIIASPKRLIYTLFLSVIIWFLSGLSVYFLFSVQHLDLSLIGAFVVVVVTTFGITLPAAPGFMGNFQFACIMALSILKIPKNDAFIFSMIYYFIGIGITALIGFAFLPFIKVSPKKIIKDIKSKLGYA